MMYCWLSIDKFTFIIYIYPCTLYTSQYFTLYLSILLHRALSRLDFVSSLWFLIPPNSIFVHFSIQMCSIYGTIHCNFITQFFFSSFSLFPPPPPPALLLFRAPYFIAVIFFASYSFIQTSISMSNKRKMVSSLLLSVHGHKTQFSTTSNKSMIRKTQKMFPIC